MSAPRVLHLQTGDMPRRSPRSRKLTSTSESASCEPQLICERLDRLHERLTSQIATTSSRPLIGYGDAHGLL